MAGKESVHKNTPPHDGVGHGNKYTHAHDEDEINGITNLTNFVLGQSLSSVCHDPKGSYPNEFSSSEQVPPPLKGDGHPIVKPAQFKSYLDKVAEPYKAFLETVNLEQLPSPKTLHKSESIRGVSGSIDKLPKIEKVSPKEVPETFYSEKFSLEDEIAFAISEEATSSVLHVQKLTNYLDLVEMDLLRHISLRRDAFFEALTNMHGLHEEVRSSCEEIDTIRTDLGKIDEDHVKGSLHVTRMCAKRDHLVEVYRKLQLVANVRQTQPTIQILLSKGDYSTALDLIHSTQQLLATELLGIQSFKHMGLQLREMAVLIERMMQAEFVQFSMGASSGLVPDALLNSSTGSDVPTLEDRVSPLVNGLLRMGKLHIALQEYRTALLADSKTLVRRCVASKLAQAAASPSLSQTTWHDTKYAVGRLTSSEFSTLLKTVFEELETQLLRVKGVHSLVLRGLEEVNVSREYREQVSTISSDALYGVCEESQDRAARLLRSRGEQHSRLVPVEFAALFDTSMAFATTVEGIAGRQCHGLRPTLLQQAKQFLDLFHANRTSSLGLLLDNEDWSQAEIVSEFQDIADQICEPPLVEETPPNGTRSATPNRELASTPPPGTPPRELRSPLPESAHAPGSPQVAANAPRNVIVVDGEGYKVVNVTLMLLKFLAEYLHCMSLIPAISTDIVHRVVEVLQLFNTRTLHLVLGAQARKLVQLKTITAKHLGLASRCISLVIALIPHLRAQLASHLPARHHVLLADLERVLADYADHREQLTSKFVSILRERITLHGRTMATLDLKDQSIPSPTPPMASLTKDAVTLHRLLLELLPAHQLQSVFARIFRDINTNLLEQLQRLELPNRFARQRLHDDIAHLIGNLRKLTMVGEPGTALEDWFKSKYPTM